MPCTDGEDVAVRCADHRVLIARHFRAGAGVPREERAVVVAPATGVQGRYYWRFASVVAVEADRGVSVETQVRRP